MWHHPVACLTSWNLQPGGTEPHTETMTWLSLVLRSRGIKTGLLVQKLPLSPAVCSWYLPHSRHQLLWESPPWSYLPFLEPVSSAAARLWQALCLPTHSARISSSLIFLSHWAGTSLLGKACAHISHWCHPGPGTEWGLRRVCWRSQRRY